MRFGGLEVLVTEPLLGEGRGPGEPSPLARGGQDELLDRLLVSALIERRSLERFLQLADAPPEGDARIQALFAELGPSEAGHANLFVELAAGRRPRPEVEARLAFWVEREAELISTLSFGVRIHSGPVPLGAEARA